MAEHLPLCEEGPEFNRCTKVATVIITIICYERLAAMNTMARQMHLGATSTIAPAYVLQKLVPDEMNPHQPGCTGEKLRAER